METSSGKRPDRPRPFKIPIDVKDLDLIGKIVKLGYIARAAAQTPITVMASDGESTRPVGNEDTIFQALLITKLRNGESVER